MLEPARLRLGPEQTVERALIAESEPHVVDIGDERLVGDHAAVGLEPHRADQDELAKRAWRLGGHLRRHPATEAEPDDGDHPGSAGDGELAEQPLMGRREIPDVAHPFRPLGSVVPEVRRHQHGEAAGELLVKGQTRERPDVVVKNQ